MSRPRLASAGDDYGSFSLSRKTAAVGLGVCQSHLLGTEFRIALTQFAGSAFDNRVAKHRYHHHKEEITGVHEMQVY